MTRRRCSWVGPTTWSLAVVALAGARLPVRCRSSSSSLLSFNEPVEPAVATTSTGSPWTTGRNPCAPAGLCDVGGRRACRSACSPRSVATVLGTLMAFALVRHRFRGRSATNLLIFLPMATPEVVMGSSLLALFVTAGLGGQLGFWTIVDRARDVLRVVRGGHRQGPAGRAWTPRLEEAAMDLYANEWQTFRRVTLRWCSRASWPPRCWLLAVLRRLHHHQLQRRHDGHVPDVVWGAAQRGIPPQVNVIGTAMFADRAPAGARRQRARQRRRAARHAGRG